MLVHLWVNTSDVLFVIPSEKLVWHFIRLASYFLLNKVSDMEGDLQFLIDSVAHQIVTQCLL